MYFEPDPTPILRSAGATSLNSVATGFPVRTRSGSHFPDPRRMPMAEKVEFMRLVTIAAHVEHARRSAGGT